MLFLGEKYIAADTQKFSIGRYRKECVENI